MNYVLSPAAVRKLRRAIAANPGNTGAGGAPSPVSVDDYPPPFTVRWSSSETSGGTWLIWLPDRSKLVVYDGTYINTISGVTAAQNFPSGYYTVNALQASSTNVYLNVTVTESTGAATAALADSPASASSGEKVYSILVATMATDQTKGTKSVKQFVDSAIIIGGEGGESVVPDDKSTEFIPNPPAGTSPDGDEGELQIKGFKAGTPADTNNIADYLMGVANVPTNGMQLLVRWTDSNGAHIAYLPIAELYQDSSGQTPTDMTVEFVADIDWYVNGSTHVLRKRLRVLNLRTGAVTDKPNTTYANGWETAANSIGISSIIGS